VDDSTSPVDPTVVAVDVSDPEGYNLDVTIEDENGNVLNNTNVATGGRVIAEYGGLTDGEDYLWTVNVSDGSSFTTSTFNFTYAYIAFKRVDTKETSEYTSNIVTRGSRDLLPFTITNPSSTDKQLETSIDADPSLDATFPDGSTTTSYDLPAGETKDFLISINPTVEGRQKVNLTTYNPSIGVSTKKTIPVQVMEGPTSATNELPGIGPVQLMVLIVGSTLLYFASL
jgi:hypothetical protein